jgi:DNA-binding LacI/PurR family transcriptional regulator
MTRRLHSKYRAIAADLEATMPEGQGPSERRLPSVRQVAEKYNVALATAARTMEILNGVVCYHDRIAIGLAIELMTRGRRVPDEVGLTGFDDQTIGQEFTLGITSYAYPTIEIAEEAIAVMRRRIERPDAPPIKVVVPSRLIVRESSTSVP